MNLITIFSIIKNRIKNDYFRNIFNSNLFIYKYINLQSNEI